MASENIQKTQIKCGFGNMGIADRPAQRAFSFRSSAIILQPRSRVRL
jgi:hypothetical protein